MNKIVSLCLYMKTITLETKLLFDPIAVLKLNGARLFFGFCIFLLFGHRIFRSIQLIYQP